MCALLLKRLKASGNGKTHVCVDRRKFTDHHLDIDDDDDDTNTFW